MARITLHTDDFNRADQGLNTPPWVQAPLYPSPMHIVSNVATGTTSVQFNGSNLEDSFAAYDSMFVEAALAQGPAPTEIDGFLAISALAGNQESPSVIENSVSLLVERNGSGQTVVTLALLLGGAETILWTDTDAHTPGTTYALEVSSISGLTGLTVDVLINGGVVATENINAYRTRLSGRGIGMARFGSVAGLTPAAWDNFSAGYLSDALTITDVNGDDIAQSNGAFVINGGGFEAVTDVDIDDGVNTTALTIESTSASSIVCTPVDIHTTQLLFGSLTVTVTDPGGSDTHAFTMEPAANQQALAISTPIAGSIVDGIIGFTDGDTIEIPTQVGNSQLTLYADGDVWHDPATPDGTVYTRWYYDDDLATWDSGTVTINREALEVDPPRWLSVPNPPIAKAGVAYNYPIGGLISGKRPLTLSDSGNPLPTGLAYNSTANAEAITGTPPSNIGEITVSGIVTRAVNVDGAAESAPYTVTVSGYPVLSAPFAVGITTSGAEVGVTTDQAVGLLYLIADPLAAEPTAQQIIDGQNASGAPASTAQTHGVAAAGVQGPFTITGFRPNSGVSFWFVQASTDGVVSNVSGQRFTTKIDPTDPSPETDPDRLTSFYNRSGSGQTAEPERLEALTNENEQQTETPEHIATLLSSPNSGNGA